MPVFDHGCCYTSFGTISDNLCFQQLSVRDAVLLLSQSSVSLACAECTIMDTQSLLRSPQASCFIASPRHPLDPASTAHKKRQDKKDKSMPSGVIKGSLCTKKQPGMMLHTSPACTCCKPAKVLLLTTFQNMSLCVGLLACLLDRNSYLST